MLSGLFGASMAIGAALQMASGISQYRNFKDAAKYAERQGDFEAWALRRRAGQERASGQRAASDIRRDFGFLSGAAQAGFGGARTVADPRMMARIAGEGDYRAGVREYESELAAQNMEIEATLRLMGASAQSGMLKAQGDAALFDSIGKTVSIGGQYASAMYTPGSGDEPVDPLGGQWGPPRRTTRPGLATKYAPVKGSGMHPALRYR